MRRPDAFLGRSKGRLELTFDQHGKEDEKERLDFRKKTFKIQCFSMVLEGPDDWFRMTLGVLSGSSLGSLGGLGVFWALGGCLGGVLGVSRSAWER